MDDLSPAMIRAITTTEPCGTITDTSRNTERALIARGLAEPVIGTTTRRNRTSYHAQTVYDAYLGARLTDKGREVAALIAARTRL